MPLLAPVMAMTFDGVIDIEVSPVQLTIRWLCLGWTGLRMVRSREFPPIGRSLSVVADRGRWLAIGGICCRATIVDSQPQITADDFCAGPVDGPECPRRQRTCLLDLPLAR